MGIYLFTENPEPVFFIGGGGFKYWSDIINKKKKMQSHFCYIYQYTWCWGGCEAMSSIMAHVNVYLS